MKKIRHSGNEIPEENIPNELLLLDLDGDIRVGYYDFRDEKFVLEPNVPDVSLTLALEIKWAYMKDVLKLIKLKEDYNVLDFHLLS